MAWQLVVYSRQTLPQEMIDYRLYIELFPSLPHRTRSKYSRSRWKCKCKKLFFFLLTRQLFPFVILGFRLLHKVFRLLRKYFRRLQIVFRLFRFYFRQVLHYIEVISWVIEMIWSASNGKGESSSVI